jgi:hypothetical protein
LENGKSHSNKCLDASVKVTLLHSLTCRDCQVGDGSSRVQKNEFPCRFSDSTGIECTGGKTLTLKNWRAGIDGTENTGNRQAKVEDVRSEKSVDYRIGSSPFNVKLFSVSSSSGKQKGHL